jgi:hypothetical protein
MTEELIEEKKLRVKKPKMIPVKVIKGNPDNSMLEFEIGGLLQRAIIPNNIIEDGKCQEDELQFGIPYGIPWENVKLSASSIDVANALRRMEIWTVEDAMSNPNRIIAALQAVYGCDLAALVMYARENS